MKTDGLDWMDWLHKVRREAEEKRIRDGLTVEQWLQQVRVRAEKAKAQRRVHEQSPVARDKPTTKPTRGRRAHRP